MVKLDQTIYLKSSNQDGEVITFGKFTELEKSDHESGLSRFGGSWRNLSYTMSYLRAARVLVENSKENHDFDQLGLPIFYLSRHALELFIKSSLELLYDVAQMRAELYSRENNISKGRIERLSSCHSLSRLNEDLKKTCKDLEFEYDPKNIDQLINKIEEYELNPTWSRYSKSIKGEKHLKDEIAVPIVNIHQSLENVVSELGYSINGDNASLQNEVYSEWSHLMAGLNEHKG